MKKSPLKSSWVPAVVAAAVVVLDRITKVYIRGAYSASDNTAVIPGFFYIDHLENSGAAFSFWADSASSLHSLLLAGVSIAVSAVIAAMLWGPSRFSAGQSGLMRTGLALVFGGALGNLWDRLFRGTVTDFLQFFFGSYEFPSFNAADTMITIGAGLLLLDLFLNRHQHQPAAQSSGSAG